MTTRSWPLLILGLLLSACAPSMEPPSADAPVAPPPPSTRKYREPMEEHFTREYRACERDGDCVYANNGCCDCANGGASIAVRRDLYTAFRARFSCTGPCTEMGGSCNDGTVACEDKLCTFRESR
jgi:hypothetical protein